VGDNQAKTNANALHFQYVKEIDDCRRDYPTRIYISAKIKILCVLTGVRPQSKYYKQIGGGACQSMDFSNDVFPEYPPLSRVF
jgi:hypothetical protein